MAPQVHYLWLPAVVTFDVELLAQPTWDLKKCWFYNKEKFFDAVLQLWIVEHWLSQWSRSTFSCLHCKTQPFVWAPAFVHIDRICQNSTHLLLVNEKTFTKKGERCWQLGCQPPRIIHGGTCRWNNALSAASGSVPITPLDIHDSCCCWYLGHPSCDPSTFRKLT